MKALRLNSSGKDVKQWQLFLAGQQYDIIVDGKFGPNTDLHTKSFQESQGLLADGVVGPNTYLKAFEKGLPFLTDQDDRSETGLNWPPKPDFGYLNSTANRQQYFGKFTYQAAAKGEIKILDNWPNENIISVHIPAVKYLRGGPANGNIWFHRKVAHQIQGLFDAWEKAGLLGQVETWAGAYYPRFVRGSNSSLSNHSFGTAFDINVDWNGLGVTPALVGHRGSVRKLVPLANEFGFYWGGHFQSRPDGMHFEIARVLPQ